MQPWFTTLCMVFGASFPWACAAPDAGDHGAIAQTPYETKSSQGDISFDLTPRVSPAGHLVVDVSANTHTGDLADLDLGGLLSLVVDEEEHRPVAATDLKGHHAVASVTFDVKPLPSRFAITIAPVRGMEELRYEWP